MEDAHREQRARRRRTARPDTPRRAAGHGARRRALQHAVRPSPAREHAPEPDAWLPLSDLGDLPALEELLANENLVESGQTIAIRLRARDPQPFEEPPHVQRARIAPSTAAPAPSPEAAPQPAPVGARRLARRRVRARRLRITFVGVLLVVALVVLPLVFLPAERTVRLVVDGEERTVSARGATVADVVRAAGVWVGPYDRVSPALGARVASDVPIRVLRAHPMVVDVDGDVRTEWVVSADAAALRDELRIPADLDLVANDALDPSTTVVFRRPVAPASPAAGPDVASTTERTEQRAIPKGVVRRNDPSLPAGTQRVVDPGANGVARVRIRSVARPGAAAEERVVGTDVVTPARPQVIAIGTRRATTTSRGTTTSTAPAPMYRNSETGGATWYDHVPGTCAHKTIPKGTVVRVTNLANGLATTCVVADRGPFAAGRIIDLTPDVFSRIASLSSGVISVRIDY